MEYLRKQGVPVKVAFPPVPVDNSFERLMFIAKYLQEPDARIANLPDMLWVSDRTIETDLQRLLGLDDPIQCRQGQMTIDLARVLHSCYTLEELTDY